MAGDQTEVLRIRLGEPLKKRLEKMCKARGAKVSGMVRNILEAACDAAESGDPLIAPLSVSSRQQPK